MQELRYLNLAVNNITRVENLERCEALSKLDLTMNFLPPAALPSLASLAPLYNLRELHLLGNPCQRWQHFRQYVVAQLPQLTRLVHPSPSCHDRVVACSTQGAGLAEVVNACPPVVACCLPSCLAHSWQWLLICYRIIPARPCAWPAGWRGCGICLCSLCLLITT